jgi:histidyl-tRNA synthetase
MAKVNASIPQGTRDFGPETVHRRNYIFNTIRTVFELYGFQPLETPAMENIETLMGKYGEEGDKLIFKILNNGLNKPEKKDMATTAFQNILAGKNDKQLTERALRYDLTIPFARYVAMNHGQLVLPFKRYQMQPVWRADKPQKGRYREFYQCDADTVGSNSLMNEVELALIYSTVFEKLGIAVEIKINSRKILAALAETCGGVDQLINITIAIDKLDKIGLDKVKEELSQRGLLANQIDVIEEYLAINGSNDNKLAAIEPLICGTEAGKKGIEEIKYVLEYTQQAGTGANLSTDFTLARGLNYYTGIIFEVKANKVQMGSIGGGGRYDDLTGSFGVPNIPGVGISFGVDRIYDVMEELKLFPAQVEAGSKALFFNLGNNESRAAFSLAMQLRNKGIACELYHEQAKFDKQFKYAEKKNIPYAVIIGDKELASQTCTVKNLASGNQQTIAQASLLQFDFSK